MLAGPLYDDYMIAWLIWICKDLRNHFAKNKLRLPQLSLITCCQKLLTVKLIELFIRNYLSCDFMGEKCQNCSKKMDSPELTHCSDECLFDEIKIERSIDDGAFSPTDDWDSSPWV